MQFNSSYGPIYYETHGSEKSGAVVFFHGMLADHRMFKAQIPVFENEYRLILWDMPWHGQSVRPDGKFEFNIVAQCLIELLDEIGVDKAVLVGVSLGSYVSQYIAHKYPERIIGVAMEGGHPLHLKLNISYVVLLRLTALIFSLLPVKAIKNYFIKYTPDEHKDYIVSILAQLDRATLLSVYQGLNDGIIRGIDEQVRQKVLITHGEFEYKFIRQMCQTWHEQNPNSDYEVMAGAGHDSFFTNSEKYNQALDLFLSKVFKQTD